MNYKVFITNLSNLNEYYRDKAKLEEEMDILFYQMTGVSGVSYDKIPSSYNPGLSEEMRLEAIEKYNAKIQQYNFICMAINEVSTIMASFPENLQNMLTDIYVEKKTFKSVGIKYGYSDSGLWHMLKRETEKYL